MKNELEWKWDTLEMRKEEEGFEHQKFAKDV
jgi:hypothetical protein